MSSRHNRQPRSERPWTATAAGVMLLALLAVGCSDNPTAPSPVTKATPSPTPGSVSAVAIAGPDTIAPGGQGQYQAIAKFADGSTKDVTANATWTSAKAQVLEIDGSGLAKSGQRGLTTLTASFMGVSQTFAVRVLEPGTFVLSGTISGEDRQPLAGATVAVESGTGTGLSTTSGAQGEFDLFGVAGAVQLGVSAPEHQSRSINLSVTRDGTTQVFLNRLIIPPPASPSALTITGQERIPEYGSVHFAATLIYSDGSRHDVTHNVTWSSIAVAGYRVAIDQRGVVQPTGLGRSWVRARIGAFEDQVVVNVGPGWVVSGNITDAGTGLVIPGAFYRVVGGQAYRLPSDDSSGTYHLFGAQGQVRLEVSYFGYVTRIVEFTVTGADAVVHVALTPECSEPCDREEPVSHQFQDLINDLATLGTAGLH